MSDECVAENAAMLSKRVGISVGAKLVQQLRRALDVGEKESDGSRWEIALHRRHHARARDLRHGTDLDPNGVRCVCRRRAVAVL